MREWEHCAVNCCGEGETRMADDVKLSRCSRRGGEDEGETRTEREV